MVAFSFTPEEVQAAHEHETPSVDRRIRAMERLQERGWRLGLRFDPLIYFTDYREQYRRLYDQVFGAVRIDSLHSVSVGPFRLSGDAFKAMVRLYPEDALFAGPLAEENGAVAYQRALEEEMVQFCTAELLRRVPQAIIFPSLSVAPAMPAHPAAESGPPV